MSTILNIDKLQDILTDADIQTLEKSAAVHKRQSNIQFDVLEVQPDAITVAIEQDKTTSGNYANLKGLTKRAHELFDSYLPSGYKLMVQPTEYLESPSAAVTPEWLDAKMQESGVRIKQLAFDTGIDRTNISAWINGLRPMSQIVKAMFYYYFESKRA